MTVGYATANGTAVAVEDYRATSGSITFAAGQTSKTVTVAVTARTGAEPDEAFFVDLSTPSRATIADGRGVGTILNDDTSVTIDDVRILEGNSGTRYAASTASLSAAVPFVVTASYATAAGAANPATAGTDYAATRGSLSFAAGEVRKSISVPILGDSAIEPDEVFFVNLDNPGNARIGRSRGIGMILDDDGGSTLLASSRSSRG